MEEENEITREIPIDIPKCFEYDKNPYVDPIKPLVHPLDLEPIEKSLLLPKIPTKNKLSFL